MTGSPESALSLSYVNNNSSIGCDFNKGLLSQTIFLITKLPMTWTTIVHVIIKILIPINKYKYLPPPRLWTYIFIMKHRSLNRAFFGDTVLFQKTMSEHEFIWQSAKHLLCVRHFSWGLSFLGEQNQAAKFPVSFELPVLGECVVHNCRKPDVEARNQEALALRQVVRYHVDWTTMPAAGLVNDGWILYLSSKYQQKKLQMYRTEAVRARV